MDIKTPDLGVESAEVSEILVKIGDKVTKNQSLLVVESAKASVEVPSPVDGTITSILVTQGQMVQEGIALFTVSGATEEVKPAVQLIPAVAAIADKVESAPKSAVKVESPVQSSVESVANEAAVAVSKTVAVPDLGVDQADISEILVQVGDVVTAGQSIAVVESAKASVEIPSPSAGTVESIAVTLGQSVKQGMPILVMRTSDRKVASSILSVAATASPSSLTTSITQPQIAQPTVQLVAPAVSPQATNAIPKTTVVESTANNADVYAGPAVRQIARQLGVDLHRVKASSIKGRVMKEDIYAYVKQRMTTAPVATSFAIASGLPPLPDVSKWGGSFDAPLTRLQQAAIPQLSLNLYIPQVTQFDRADITDLEQLRVELKDEYKKQGIGLTILAFIAKATAHLLLKEPRFNSHLNDDGRSIKVRAEVHLGIAVATDDGLIVPVLRNPDRLSIHEIAKQLAEMSQKARDKKLGPNDLSGATFTISSLGAMGGTGFTPLVNWPQVAILGLSPAVMQPIWNGTEFQPRLMLPLSLSYDHRVINGVDAARFARALAVLLEDLRRLLL